MIFGERGCRFNRTMTTSCDVIQRPRCMLSLLPALYRALPGKVCDCYYNHVGSVEKKSEEDRGKLNVLG